MYEFSEESIMNEQSNIQDFLLVHELIILQNNNDEITNTELMENITVLNNETLNTNVLENTIFIDRFEFIAR